MKSKLIKKNTFNVFKQKVKHNIKIETLYVLSHV